MILLYSSKVGFKDHLFMGVKNIGVILFVLN